MFITSREKSIIDLIVKTSGKHTAHSLSTFLNVSVRTIQRDLKSVERVLNQFDLKLERTTNEGLLVEGKNEHVYKLIQHLSDVQPTDETPEERKLRLLIMLFHEGESFKIQVLAKQLGVSMTTMTAYLDDLASWLKKFHIQLSRKRGVGIEILAEEVNIRKALANYFLVYFHEELIENLYVIQSSDQVKGSVLNYFSPHYLKQINSLVNTIINRGPIRLADSDYLGLIVHICITIQRTENKFVLQQEEQIVNEYMSEYELMKQLCQHLQTSLFVTISEKDLRFLTIIYIGAKLQTINTNDYDIKLGQKIKNVIQQVSSQLNVDLTKDFSLFQGLLAHMKPSLFRLQQQMGLYNPLTTEIKGKYPVLFLAVQECLKNEFPDIRFPDDEVAFIVLHFGSALLMNEEKVMIHAVVVCPTGIGTSKMLASRIQKEIDEIYSVEIKSIKDFELANPEEYDVILSTVRLPYNDLDYLLVSPLLNNEDIDNIRGFIQNNLHELTRGNKYHHSVKNRSAFAKGKKGFRQLFQEIKDVQTSMEELLHNLRVYRKGKGLGHIQILKEMVEQAEREQFVTDTNEVLEKLEDREEKGGLGIPNTNMGLFHCRAESITTLIFQVAHLEEPCYVKGMDGKTVQMKSLLLMLAPVHLSTREQEILSLISTSLIENEAAMMIFSSSNEELIREKIEDIFLDYLANNLIKE